jgi:hypothetical protein
MALLLFIRSFPVRELASFVKVPECGSGRGGNSRSSCRFFEDEKEHEP